MDSALDQNAKLTLVTSRSLATFLEGNWQQVSGRSVHLLYCDSDYQVHLISMTKGRLPWGLSPVFKR